MNKSPNNSFDNQKKVKFINPPNKLKSKMGSGGLPAHVIERAEEKIKKSTFDIIPYARQYLDLLESGLETVNNAPEDFLALKDQIIEPIMQLKGNCGMFHYVLLSDVAAIALHFLEVVEDWNPDAQKVISAHIKTIETIINNNMKGTGGDAGHVLSTELHKACERYFAKYPVEK